MRNVRRHESEEIHREPSEREEHAEEGHDREGAAWVFDPRRQFGLRLDSGSRLLVRHRYLLERRRCDRWLVGAPRASYRESYTLCYNGTSSLVAERK